MRGCALPAVVRLDALPAGCYDGFMELRHLRYFEAVAGELHFGRAARRLRVAQPALSQQVRALEDRLGVRLLERSRRHVALTPAGEVFLAETRAVLGRAAAAEEAARAAHAGTRGTLRLGAITSFRSDRLHAVLQDFRRRFPAVELQFTDRTPAGLERALLDRQVDVAFLRPPLRDPSLGVAVVEQAEWMVVLPEAHPLAKRAAVTWRQLAGGPFIQLADEESPGFNTRLREHALRHGFVPEIRHACREMHTIVWLVSLGLGLAVMVTGMRHLLTPGVVGRPFRAPRPTIETLMAWRRDDPSPVPRRFVELALPALRLAGPDSDDRSD